MLEGRNAWALPGVAAFLLAAFFAYRCSVPDTDATATAPAPAPAPAPPAKTQREQIEAAIADAGASAPPLPDRHRTAVAAAFAPVVARCRDPRPEDAAIALAIHVEVAGARDLGGVVRTLEVRGLAGAAPSAGLVACIDEAARSLALPDAAATGVGNYDFEVPP